MESRPQLDRETLPKTRISFSMQTHQDDEQISRNCRRPEIPSYHNYRNCSTRHSSRRFYHGRWNRRIILYPANSTTNLERSRLPSQNNVYRASPIVMPLLAHKADAEEKVFRRTIQQTQPSSVFTPSQVKAEKQIRALTTITSFAWGSTRQLFPVIDFGV